jgi:hypothetical protein
MISPVKKELLSKIEDQLRINPYYIKELEKLKDFSVKRNYDDFTFHCNQMVLYCGVDPIDEFTLECKKFIQFDKLFDVINKKFWIFSEDPFNVTDLSTYGKISIYCNYEFKNKSLRINGIKDFTLNVNNFLISYHELKNDKLDDLISIIKKLSNNFKNLESCYEIENYLMFEVFKTSDWFSLYQNENLTRKEKLEKYFSKRNLV